jgi:hypothetical protein
LHYTIHQSLCARETKISDDKIQSLRLMKIEISNYFVGLTPS